MKNYAFIDSTSGRVVGVVGVTAPEIYYDGAQVDGKLCKELPLEIPPQIAVESKRWNGAAFVDMPAQPNRFYIWGIDNWVFDAATFDTEARQFRNATLASCDWTQVPDAPITAAKVEEWKTYRQALRDLPSTWSAARDLDEIVWPTPPV